MKKLKNKKKNWKFLLDDYQIKNKDSNYIIAEIIIKDEKVNKDIRILSSHEECVRLNPGVFSKDKKFNNEDEIKNVKYKLMIN